MVEPLLARSNDSPFDALLSICVHHRLPLDLRSQSTDTPTTVGARLEASRLLAAEVGHAVAQLFYTHEAMNAAGKDDMKKPAGPFSDPT